MTSVVMVVVNYDLSIHKKYKHKDKRLMTSGLLVQAWMQMATGP